MKGRLEGRRIIIFGAATGIGAATAKRLVQEGARVCVADINVEGAARTANAAGGEAFAVQVDIADEASVNAATEAAVARFGGLDGAHVNAADLKIIMQDSTALDIDLAVFDRTMAVNLRGHLLCTRAVVPHLLKNAASAIVYTSSGAAHAGEAVRPCYAITKAGINALARHVAAAYGKKGLTANVIAPGFTVTEQMKAQMQADGTDPKQWSELYLTRSAASRLGEPEDHAGVVAMLLSDDGRWISGAIFDVNGGAMMRA
ncbi:MAG: SDR family oxidoreductase [Hyphomonadaceae bacterium]|nr:SDR family oxidoreductase [Hyphomonadaceae bacterium]